MAEQDAEYLKLMAEREAEYAEEMTNKMDQFRREHAARILQVSWRAVLVNRKEKKKVQIFAADISKANNGMIKAIVSIVFFSLIENN